MARAAAGTPTALNLWAMGDLFRKARGDVGGEVPSSISNALDVVDAPHIRRCLRAGLLTVSADRKRLELTESGRLALAAEMARHEAGHAARQVDTVSAGGASRLTRQERIAAAALIWPEGLTVRHVETRQLGTVERAPYIAPDVVWVTWVPRRLDPWRENAVPVNIKYLVGVSGAEGSRLAPKEEK